MHITIFIVHISFLYTVLSLQQYCDQIDLIEGSVSKLEQTAYRLDNYAKQLGKSFWYKSC